MFVAVGSEVAVLVAVGALGLVAVAVGVVVFVAVGAGTEVFVAVGADVAPGVEVFPEIWIFFYDRASTLRSYSKGVGNIHQGHIGRVISGD